MINCQSAEYEKGRGSACKISEGGSEPAHMTVLRLSFSKKEKLSSEG